MNTFERHLQDLNAMQNEEPLPQLIIDPTLAHDETFRSIDSSPSPQDSRIVKNSLIDKSEVHGFLQTVYDINQLPRKGAKLSFQQKSLIGRLYNENEELFDTVKEFLMAKDPNMILCNNKVSDILISATAMLVHLYLHPQEEGGMEIYKAEIDFHVYDQRPTSFSGAIRTSPVRKALRAEATKNLEKNGLKMQEEYNKKNKTQMVDYAVGSKVSIKVPKEDRRKSDPLRVPGEVIEVRGEKRKTYRIKTAAGILEKKCRPEEMQPFEGNTFSQDTPEKVVTLREAARNEQLTLNRCQCKSGCKDKRCRCFKDGNFCQSTCHGATSCCNKKSHS